MDLEHHSIHPLTFVLIGVAGQQESIQAVIRREVVHTLDRLPVYLQTTFHSHIHIYG